MDKQKALHAGHLLNLINDENIKIFHQLTGKQN